jgi:DNA-binding NarL/FixJ family response regulator
VVADDHPPLRQAVSAILAAHGIEVVALASDGSEARAAIAAYRPRVAILDLVMPRLTGVEVASWVARAFPETGVILYTGHVESSLLVDALDAGALGFVLKGTPTVELVTAVELVAGGGGYVDPELAATLVKASVEADLPALSARERDILRLRSEGKSEADVGEALHVSPDSVRASVRQAIRELEADARTRAVATAIRLWLID